MAKIREILDISLPKSVKKIGAALITGGFVAAAISNVWGGAVACISTAITIIMLDAIQAYREITKPSSRIISSHPQITHKLSESWYCVILITSIFLIISVLGLSIYKSVTNPEGEHYLKQYIGDLTNQLAVANTSIITQSNRANAEFAKSQNYLRWYQECITQTNNPNTPEVIHSAFVTISNIPLSNPKDRQERFNRQNQLAVIADAENKSKQIDRMTPYYKYLEYADKQLRFSLAEPIQNNLGTFSEKTLPALHDIVFNNNSMNRYNILVASDSTNRTWKCSITFENLYKFTIQFSGRKVKNASATFQSQGSQFNAILTVDNQSITDPCKFTNTICCYSNINETISSLMQYQTNLFRH